MISIFLCVQSTRLKSFLTIQMMTAISNSSYKNRHISFKYTIKRWLIQSRSAFFMTSSMTLKELLFLIEKITDAYKRKLRFIRFIWRSETFNLKTIYSISPLNRHHPLTVALNLNPRVFLGLVIPDQKFVATSGDISRNLVQNLTRTAWESGIFHGYLVAFLYTDLRGLILKHTFRSAQNPSM